MQADSRGPGPVLVYDGDCGFCTRTARRAERRVARGRYDVAPWQRLDLSVLGLSPQVCVEAAQFVDREGRTYAGHRAIAAALRHGGGCWGWAGWSLGVPGVDALAGVTYRWVAGHRHRLPGGTPVCSGPGSLRPPAT